MVKYITQDTLHNIILYEIEFNDLSHITSLSKDCFGLIKEFCGRSYCGDLTKVKPNELFWFACKNNVHDVIGELFERNDKEEILKSNYYRSVFIASYYEHEEILNWIKYEFPNFMNNMTFSCEGLEHIKFVDVNGFYEIPSRASFMYASYLKIVSFYDSTKHKN